MDEFCSSKNPYGNKTINDLPTVMVKFCSSKNPYGNKTNLQPFCHHSCSVLAKILMVTKHDPKLFDGRFSSVLAKILMVTKH